MLVIQHKEQIYYYSTHMAGDRWDWNSAITNRLYSGVNAGVENSATSLMCR